jgi:Cdc6-like AAA superfamily ATPase
MANYEAENEFVFDFRKMVQLIKRGLRIGMSIQIFLCIWMLYSTDFYTLSREPINPRVTIKYFLAYAYPDQPKSSMETLDVELQLRQYASAFSSQISVDTKQLSGEWYQALANFVSGGAYAHVVRILKYTFFSYIFSLLYIWYFVAKSKKRILEEYMRGSKIIPQKNFDIYWQAKSKGNGIRIGTTIIPDFMVTKHILILGTTGTGKGVLLNQMIQQIKKKQTNPMVELPPQILFYDIKGEFVQKHYQEGDVILNPFDDRCVGWSIFNEFQTGPELDAISKALFYRQKTRIYFFMMAHRQFFVQGCFIWYEIRKPQMTHCGIFSMQIGVPL